MRGKTKGGERMVGLRQEGSRGCHRRWALYFIDTVPLECFVQCCLRPFRQYQLQPSRVFTQIILTATAYLLPCYSTTNGNCKTRGQSYQFLLHLN